MIRYMTLNLYLYLMAVMYLSRLFSIYSFHHSFFFFFFFNDTATTEIYTLSLHDALPIYWTFETSKVCGPPGRRLSCSPTDRKSTRLNSSHGYISYAVFCLKKKKKKKSNTPTGQYCIDTIECTEGL